MSIQVEGGCEWPDLPYSDCCEAPEDDARRAHLEKAIVGWLFRETGCRFPGTGCQAMVQPPNDCCACHDHCRCVGFSSALPIRIGPPDLCVDDLALWVCGTEVLNNGANPLRLFRTAHATYVQRQDGGHWPEGQDWSGDPMLPECSCGGCCGCSWGIAYSWSMNPPAMVLEAAAQAVCHFAGLCNTDADCCGSDSGRVTRPGPEVDTMTIGTARYTFTDSNIRSLPFVREVLAQFPPPQPVGIVHFSEDVGLSPDDYAMGGPSVSHQRVL